MEKFSKNCGCPPSAELLAFQSGEFFTENCTAILSHLAECEFCSAEVSFYRLYPPIDVAFEPAPMPEPLFELAEALLVKNRGMGAFKNLIGEINSVKERR